MENKKISMSNNLKSLYSRQVFKELLKYDKRINSGGLVCLQHLKWLNTGGNIFWFVYIDTKDLLQYLLLEGLLFLPPTLSAGCVKHLLWKDTSHTQATLSIKLGSRWNIRMSLEFFISIGNSSDLLKQNYKGLKNLCFLQASGNSGD